ncbi:MAG: hypothetical protein QM597_08225 [Aeromicrobium sp.]|uniref:DUF7507 domain-containing protein n=1 Tax=Aeromicrobium sp. TaxID=1871063 RepID=UPI0039E2464F
MVVGAVVAPVSAAPGSPGTPSDPVELWHEDFESGLDSGEVVPLVDTGSGGYVGQNGETYTADYPWDTPARWNGLVYDGNSTNAAMEAVGVPTGNTSAKDGLRTLATTLGTLNGTDPVADNHVLAAYTSGSPHPGNVVQFATTAPLPIEAQNRFISFSVNAAATSCWAAHPVMRFFLVDGTEKHRVSATDLDPCTGYVNTGTSNNPSGPYYMSATLTADSAFLFSGDELGIEMRNMTATAAGNDGAIDDIKVLDVSPQLDKEFVAGSGVPGTEARLRFTVTNTSELGAKAGWGFTDTLPAGLTVAPTPDFSSSCANSVVGGAAGDASVSLTGDLTAGQSSCVAEIDVLVPLDATPGHVYANGPSNISDVAGLNLPGTATLTVPLPGLAIDKTAILDDTNGNYLADVGEMIAYSFEVTNTGGLPLSGVSVVDALVSGLSPSGFDLAVGESRTVTADPYTVTEADLLAGSVDNSAMATGSTPGGDSVVSDPDTTTTTTMPAQPRLLVEKTADLDDVNGNGVADAGETISYSFEVSNTGNLTITDVSVADERVSGLDPTGFTLEPGENQTVTADPYTVTEADVLAGDIHNSATATGTSSGGDPVESPESTTTTPTPPVTPKLLIEKTAVLDDADESGTADAGETITYSFVVTNTGNVTVSDISVDDPLVTGLDPSGFTLEPGESQTVTADVYTVDEADLLAGWVHNSASASGVDPNDDPVVSPPDTTTTTTTLVTPSLVIDKTADHDDANGNGVADVGETITYSFTVANAGNVTLTDLSVTDPRVTGLSPSGFTLAPGEDQAVTADVYTVTEADVLAGKVLNSATATGLRPGGGEVTSPPDVVTVDTPEVVTELTIVKAAALHDANGSGLGDAGETIAYSFEVTNTGNVTMTGISVVDPLVTGLTPTGFTLAPGQVQTVTADDYTITTDDVRRGSVDNVATATGIDPLGGSYTSDESTVSTATAGAALPRTGLGITPGHLFLGLLLALAGVSVIRIVRRHQPA